jgi:adenine deaminase
MSTFRIKGNLVDCFTRSLTPSVLHISSGKIQSIEPVEGHSPRPDLPYIMPGFTDAHVHIESSMLIPSAFAHLAVIHGTVATVSDPHEIANVCGVEGVEFMIDNAKEVPFKFYFGAPSCVPATSFETAGDILDPAAVQALLERDEVKYLSEMMNFPGAIAGDPEVIAKIASARKLGKVVDGHAPGLRGELLQQYINRGISTDHECFTREEAEEKIMRGMKVLIREGSAAKNFDALIGLLDVYPEMIMFCSDDKHPDSLAEGHINQLCARAVAAGCDVFNVIRAAAINPVLHYQLETGVLRPGDNADFIVVNNLSDFLVKETYINGVLVAKDGSSLMSPFKPPASHVNRFEIGRIEKQDLVCKADHSKKYPVIGCIDGQLITEKLSLSPAELNGNWVPDLEKDVLKLVVVNRYHKAPVAVAFIHRFGLKSGAIASSVAHDSHNIVAVGTDDSSLLHAINLVVDAKGGISCVGGNSEMVLPLPVGGLMSLEDGYQVAAAYTALDKAAKSLGSQLNSPFMSLSFMALLVIPHLKLSDKGLFDGDAFKFYE